MPKLNDSELEKLVRQSLNQDSRIDTREVNVRVIDGVVYLTGTVDSAAERAAVREAVEQSIPVDMVVDELLLRNYVDRSDEELAVAVKVALLRDPNLEAAPMIVSATSGVVTLSGKVQSYVQKTSAETVAWWTPGVVEVVNRLEVAGIGHPPDEPDY